MLLKGNPAPARAPAMLPAPAPTPTIPLLEEMVAPLLFEVTTVLVVPSLAPPFPDVATPNADLEPDPLAAALLAAAPEPAAALAAPDPAEAALADPLDPAEPAIPKEPPELVDVEAADELPPVDDPLADAAPADDPPELDADDEAAPLDSPGRLVSEELEAAEADPLEPEDVVVVAVPPTSVVVVVAAAFAGNELLNRSRVAAPNNERGLVMALSNHAPEDAPPEASRF